MRAALLVLILMLSGCASVSPNPGWNTSHEVDNRHDIDWMNPCSTEGNICYYTLAGETPLTEVGRDESILDNIVWSAKAPTWFFGYTFISGLASATTITGWFIIEAATVGQAQHGFYETGWVEMKMGSWDEDRHQTTIPNWKHSMRRLTYGILWDEFAMTLWKGVGRARVEVPLFRGRTFNQPPWYINWNPLITIPLSIFRTVFNGYIPAVLDIPNSLLHPYTRPLNHTFHPEDGVKWEDTSEEPWDLHNAKQ